MIVLILLPLLFISCIHAMGMVSVHTEETRLQLSWFVRVVDQFTDALDAGNYTACLVNFAENVTYYSPDYGWTYGKKSLLSLLETIPKKGIVAMAQFNQGDYVGGVDGLTLIRIWRDAVSVKLPNGGVISRQFSNVVTFDFDPTTLLVTQWTEYAEETHQTNATSMSAVVRQLYKYEEAKNVNGVLSLLTQDFQFLGSNAPCNKTCLVSVLQGFFASVSTIDIIESAVTIRANHVNVEGTLCMTAVTGASSISAGADVFELVVGMDGKTRIRSWLTGNRVM